MQYQLMGYSEYIHSYFILDESQYVIVIYQMDNIPIEIYFYIMQFTGSQDICSFRIVSKFYKNIIDRYFSELVGNNKVIKISKYIPCFDRIGYKRVPVNSTNDINCVRSLMQGNVFINFPEGCKYKDDVKGVLESRHSTNKCVRVLRIIRKTLVVFSKGKRLIRIYALTPISKYRARKIIKIIIANGMIFNVGPEIGKSLGIGKTGFKITNVVGDKIIVPTNKSVNLTKISNVEESSAIVLAESLQEVQFVSANALTGLLKKIERSFLSEYPHEFVSKNSMVANVTPLSPNIDGIINTRIRDQMSSCMLSIGKYTKHTNSAILPGSKTIMFSGENIYSLLGYKTISTKRQMEKEISKIITYYKF